MDFIDDLTNNDFLLMLIDEKQYSEKLSEIIKAVEASNTKICYVCLNKPYKDVLSDLKQKGLDFKRFFFIDILTSHYEKPEPVDNCIFLPSPSNLESLRDAIKKAMDNGCSAIIMDTISTLLVYQEASSIVKLTHNIITDGKKDVKKLFIVLKEEPVMESNKALVDDLTMFADKKIEVNHSS